MFYFGRIISAFFNQLFRFLLWNKIGQKLLIILIISLIALWCVGMTKVHAVSEVSEISYEVRSYYDNLVNDAILRLEKNWDSLSDNWKNYFLNNENTFYFYYGYSDGSQYNNARPSNNTQLNIARIPRGNFLSTATATTNDYLGVTGHTMYLRNNTLGAYFSNNNWSPGQSNNIYIPLFAVNYISPNWTTFINAKASGDTETIIQLLNDIKAEQQATNEFLNEDADTSNIVIDTPSVTDAASDTMSNNLHNQINTLTTNLQTTVSNYYEGQDAYTWKIPWPSYIGGYLTFDSGVTRRIIGSNGVIYNVIQAIWVVLFGGYIVGFIKRMLDWVQTGKIFDEGGIADFIWWMDTNNEIIKASMM